MTSDPDEVEQRRKGQENLRELAAEHESVLWDGAARPGPRAGLNASMDVGPSRRIASDLRAMSVRSRARGTDVPKGSSTPGAGWLVLGLVLFVLVAAGSVLALLYAVTS